MASPLISGPMVDVASPSRRDDELCDSVLQRGDELVEDAGLHEDAVGADAGLARVAELRRHRARDRLLEVGVIEDDERRVAAELERQLLDGVGATGDRGCLPTSVDPVNVSLRTRVIGGQHLADSLAPSVS